MVLTVSFGLSPVIGLFCHRRQRDETQTRRQRRGVRTTRLRRPRQRHSSSAPPASTASRPASVTIASRPFVGRDQIAVFLFLPSRQLKLLKIRNRFWSHPIRPIDLVSWGSRETHS